MAKVKGDCRVFHFAYSLEKVDLIFRFCVSSDKDFAKNHMRLLSKVAARIADDDLLNQIKDSGQPQEIVSLMCGESA